VSITLTPIGPDDWRTLRELRARVLSIDPDAFGSTLELEQEYDEAHWRDRLDRGYSVVALLDHRPVGLGGLFEVRPGFSMVVSMWVAPEARCRGIGRMILDDVLSAVPSGNRVLLWVTDGNSSARRLYERAGFVDTGEQEPLRPGSPLTKCEMELRR
jgi:ribosomal protein S18 acetylase RimI-like enzyme